MAGISTPSAQPQEAAKSMSSRLLNMKVSLAETRDGHVAGNGH